MKPLRTVSDWLTHWMPITRWAWMLIVLLSLRPWWLYLNHAPRFERAAVEVVFLCVSIYGILHPTKWQARRELPEV